MKKLKKNERRKKKDEKRKLTVFMFLFLSNLCWFILAEYWPCTDLNTPNNTVFLR